MMYLQEESYPRFTSGAKREPEILSLRTVKRSWAKSDAKMRATDAIVAVCRGGCAG